MVKIGSVARLKESRLPRRLHFEKVFSGELSTQNKICGPAMCSSDGSQSHGKPLALSIDLHVMEWQIAELPSKSLSHSGINAKTRHIFRLFDRSC
jgi:hypothetical protein